MTPSQELVTVCRQCDGAGRQGFMGVAIVPCFRCQGSGKDPQPYEPLSECTYSLTDKGREALR